MNTARSRGAVIHSSEARQLPGEGEYKKRVRLFRPEPVLIITEDSYESYCNFFKSVDLQICFRGGDTLVDELNGSQPSTFCGFDVSGSVSDNNTLSESG